MTVYCIFDQFVPAAQSLPGVPPGLRFTGRARRGGQGCSVLPVWSDSPLPLKGGRGWGLTGAQEQNSPRMGSGLLRTGENQLIYKPPSPLFHCHPSPTRIRQCRLEDTQHHPGTATPQFPLQQRAQKRKASKINSNKSEKARF